MVVLFLYVRDHDGLGNFCTAISSKNQPHISYTTVWQYWLDIAKPKNVFRLTLNPPTSCYEMLKIYSVLTEFLLTTYLTIFDSTMERAMGYILHCLMMLYPETCLCPEMCLFTNRSMCACDLSRLVIFVTCSFRCKQLVNIFSIKLFLFLSGKIF